MEYYEHYKALNRKLNQLVTNGADLLKSHGYHAIALTTDLVDAQETEKDWSTLLPHKTVATRAGLGWIGKSALLVTEEYGSMVRISSIVTDAPLTAAQPVNDSRCADCMACAHACPAGAVLGKNWQVGMKRDEFYDAFKCRRVARERSQQGLGVEITLCGKCIEVCPYTRRYMSQNCL